MKQALKLAEKGKGFVSPNPLVGCIIVKNKNIIGKGFHEKFGNTHAEINALNSCEESPVNSDIYVTLEPCSHFGKTPPCAVALVNARVKNVYIAMKDPNPLVSGKGIEILNNAGINVKIGILENEALNLNKYFIHFITEKMPYIILKSAISIDGFIADEQGTSKWISDEVSRKEVHSLRSEVDAVLVGAGTVIADNPLLNVRMTKGRNPKKIIFDYKNKLNGDFKLFDENTIYVCNSQLIDKIKLNSIIKKKSKILSIGDFNIAKLLKEFVKMGIASILVEGGAFTSGLFLESGCVNELLIYQAPIILGKGISLFKLTNNRTMDKKIVLGNQDTKLCLQGLWKKQGY